MLNLFTLSFVIFSIFKVKKVQILSEVYFEKNVFLIHDTLAENSKLITDNETLTRVIDINKMKSSIPAVTFDTEN